jgi:signal transduction histidine kinase
MVATLMVLVLAMIAFAVEVTVRYRDGLEHEIRAHLLAGASALRKASSDQVKPIISSLALEGIAVRLDGAAPSPSKLSGARARRAALVGAAEKPGAIASQGQLLTITAKLAPGFPYASATLSASAANVDQAVQRLVVTELVGAAIVLGFAIVTMLVALRSALSPLEHVSAVAQRIAGGERNQRLRPRRPDTELGRMAASVDAMVDSLEQAAAQARQSESAMRRFLADASHELRTPIAALQATAETLLREQPERPRRDRLEAQLARETQRLGGLVDDLLNLARLEAQEAPSVERVDLTRIAQALVVEAQVRAEPTRIELTHHGPAVVLGDPDALSRALRNLLDNALGVCLDRRDGEVHLDVNGSATSVTVTVTDNGPGVPSDQRERIFEGFVRLPAATHPGFGLGLPIARRIAQQHHGDITCDQAKTGAQFTLRLPPAPSTLPPRPGSQDATDDPRRGATTEAPSDSTPITKAALHRSPQPG